MPDLYSIKPLEWLLNADDEASATIFRADGLRSHYIITKLHDGGIQLTVESRQRRIREPVESVDEGKRKAQVHHASELSEWLNHEPKYVAIYNQVKALCELQQHLDSKLN